MFTEFQTCYYDFDDVDTRPIETLYHASIDEAKQAIDAHKNYANIESASIYGAGTSLLGWHLIEHIRFPDVNEDFDV